MEYYYKQIDDNNNIKMLLTCSKHLESSDTQIEITEQEYNELLIEMQEIINNESEE